MPLVQQNIAVTLVAQDAAGNLGRHTVYVPDITDRVAAENFGIAYAALVAEVIDTEIVSLSVTTGYFENTFPTPGMGTDVEDKALFTVRTQDNAVSALAMPGLQENKLVGTGPEAGRFLDFTDADVIALVDAIEDGLTVDNSQSVPVLVQPCDGRGSDYATVTAGYKQQRTSQKGRGRRIG